MSFRELIEQIATAEQTEMNFLTDGQFSCTYGELPARLAMLDAYFQQQGIGAATCLAVECPNSVPGALTILYLLQQGIGFVLLPPAEQEEQASELKPLPHFCAQRLVVKRAAASKNMTPVMTSDIVRDGAGDAAWAYTPAQFLVLESNPNYQPPPTDFHPVGKLFLRTSGSMGASKLVVHSQTKLLDNARNCVTKYHFTSADRAVIPVPIAHMYGLGAEFLPAILVGASIDLQDRTNLLKYLEREKQFQPTIAFVTPTICDMLLKGFKRPRTTYKVIVTSGQRIGEALFCAFDERVNGRLVNQYGSSEMGATAACNPGDSLEHKATTIGHPMANVQLAIHERSDGMRTAEDGSGELYCQHPYGFAGYVDETGAWLYQAEPNQWYATGDLAKRLPDGSIQVVGRAGNSVNRRGYLVQFADIEQRMEKIADIEHVIVVHAAGKTNGETSGENKQGERIAAFCVLKPSAMTTVVQLRQHCFDLLPAYAVPDDILLIETLPLLPSGKVDRRALMALTG